MKRNNCSHFFGVKLLVGLCALTQLLSPLRAHAEDAAAAPLPSESATKEIVKVTDSGLTPQDITINAADSTVFLVNFSESSPVDVAIEFGARRVHCHSKNLKLDEAGMMRTVKPVSPQDFAVLCFPEKGSYPYTVSFVSGKKQSYKGTVVIN